MNKRARTRARACARKRSKADRGPTGPHRKDERAHARASEADRGPTGPRKGRAQAGQPGQGGDVPCSWGGGGVLTKVVFKCEGRERGDVDDISKIKKTLFLVFVGQ